MSKSLLLNQFLAVKLCRWPARKRFRRVTKA
jgi:hypothetical protein